MSRPSPTRDSGLVRRMARIQLLIGLGGMG